MYQLGIVLLLAGLGTAVLPNVSEPYPDPHHAPHIAHVLLGRCGKYHHRADHRTHRRRLHSWCVVRLASPFDVRPDFFTSPLPQLFSAVGTLLTGCAIIYFAVIDPSAPYWAAGFPSACLVVLGADFTFASGTMFISKVSLPGEQSVAGALFQAMTQIGSAIGLSVSTIVFNGVLRAQSGSLGVSLGQESEDAPPAAQLKAYRAAMWTGFAFGILCEFWILPVDFGTWFRNRLTRMSNGFFLVSGTVLCVFLRGAGIVGATRTRDVRLDLQGHDSCHEKERELSVQDAESK